MQKEIASSAVSLEGWNYEKDAVGLFKNHSILHKVSRYHSLRVVGKQ
jgi:hypothetical protein